MIWDATVPIMTLLYWFNTIKMSHWSQVIIALDYGLAPIHYSMQLKAIPSAIHYIDVIMTTMASQITSITVVYSTV